MSDINQSNWSETDSDNTSTTTLPGFPENMNPSLVDDSARAMMGAIRRWYDRSNPAQTSGGTANVQTLTYTVAPESLVAGDVFRFVAGFTNTGAATLNVNGLGAINCTVFGNACTGGEIVAGLVSAVAYDGTNFQILNPQTVYEAQRSFMDTSDAAGTITVTASAQQIAQLSEGYIAAIWVANTSTGATVLNFGGFTADVLRPSGAAILAGDVQADAASFFWFNGTSWNLFLNFSQQFANFNSPLVGMVNGVPSEIFLGTNLELSGDTLNCTA